MGQTKRCLDWVTQVDPWPEAVDGRVLLDGLRGLLRRLLVLPKWGAEGLALWILHTYAFELREVTAYLGIESPVKRCGKSTLLTALSRLVSRPVVSTNISPPAFFRVIEEVRPTLLIDEADGILRRNEELRGILNSGYTKPTAFVVRVAYQTAGEAQGVRREAGGAATEAGEAGAAQLVRYSCWCPKALASIGRLPETLADRCIVLRMQRKRPMEECERLRRLEGVARDLSRQCARFVADHQREISEAQPEIPEALNDRAADIWEPLLALADLAGGEWPEVARQAAVGLTASAEENSPIGSLLMDLFVMFTNQCVEAGRAKNGENGARGQLPGRMFSRTMVQILNLYVDRPWMELRRGKAITELWLAQQLRPLGIQPRTLRIGEERAKGYIEEEFRDAFQRYIPRSEVEAFRAELMEWKEAAPPNSGR